MLLNVGSGGGAAAAPTAGGGAAAAEAPAEEAKKEEKEEGKSCPSPFAQRSGLTLLCLAEKEESDEDMGLGLFD